MVVHVADGRRVCKGPASASDRIYNIPTTIFRGMYIAAFTTIII